jgi:hypothetical protein
MESAPVSQSSFTLLEVLKILFYLPDRATYFSPLTYKAPSGFATLVEYLKSPS